MFEKLRIRPVHLGMATALAITGTAALGAQAFAAAQKPPAHHAAKAQSSQTAHSHHAKHSKKHSEKVSTKVPNYVPKKYRKDIAKDARHYQVPANLIAAQIQTESHFNAGAQSGAGAKGIAQFTDATAAEYGLKDPWNATQSIRAEAKMMHHLINEFGSINLALAAYNAGPGAVQGSGGVPAIPETQAYVAQIRALMASTDHHHARHKHSKHHARHHSHKSHSSHKEHRDSKRLHANHSSRTHHQFDHHHHHA